MSVLALEKFTCGYLFQNCTGNHLIIYTNTTNSVQLYCNYSHKFICYHWVKK